MRSAMCARKRGSDVTRAPPRAALAHTVCLPCVVVGAVLVLSHAVPQVSFVEGVILAPLMRLRAGYTRGLLMRFRALGGLRYGFLNGSAVRFCSACACRRHDSGLSRAAASRTRTHRVLWLVLC